jgi:nucleoside-diphosphate kinase
MTSGPVLVMVWEGDNIISVLRGMMGKTNPVEAAPGTIRGDLAQQTGRNIIHGSDSSESAKREIELFFNDYELLSYEACNKVWLFE